MNPDPHVQVAKINRSGQVIVAILTLITGVVGGYFLRGPGNTEVATPQEDAQCSILVSKNAGLVRRLEEVTEELRDSNTRVSDLTRQLHESPARDQVNAEKQECEEKLRSATVHIQQLGAELSIAKSDAIVRCVDSIGKPVPAGMPEVHSFGKLQYSIATIKNDGSRIYVAIDVRNDGKRVRIPISSDSVIVEDDGTTRPLDLKSYGGKTITAGWAGYPGFGPDVRGSTTVRFTVGFPGNNKEVSKLQLVDVNFGKFGRLVDRNLHIPYSKE